jgi:elongation factor 2
MYVSKMIPTSDKGRFYAFGRVFSGKVGSGLNVRVLGDRFDMDNYVTSGGCGVQDVYVGSVQRTVLCMARERRDVENVPCGNTVALVGLDQYIAKTATIADSESRDCFPFKSLNITVKPVVRVAVECKITSDLPKLVEGLRRLSKSDPLVQCSIQENGQHIIAGAGELHLEICIKDLQDDYMGGCAVSRSDPVVSFRETVASISQHDVMTKTSNKHNRFHFRCIPLGIHVTDAIEDSEDQSFQDVKVRLKNLSTVSGWEKDLTKRVWSLGPDYSGANVLLDNTKGVQCLNEIKDSVVSAFQIQSKNGPLCFEKLRGCRFDLVDCYLHTDSIHRGGGQVIPATQRAIFAAFLCSQPRIMEPIYLVEIQTPDSALAGIYSTLNTKRGKVVEKSHLSGLAMSTVE